MPLAEKPDIDALVEQRNTDGLLEILREAEDEDLRMQVARAIVRILVDILERTCAVGIVCRRVRYLALERAFDRARDLLDDLTGGLELDRGLIVALARDLSRAREVEFALAGIPRRELEPTLDLGFGREFERNLALATDLTLALACDHELDREVNRELTPELFDELFRELYDELIFDLYPAKDPQVAAASAGSGLGELEAVSWPVAARELILFGNEFAQQGKVVPAIVLYEEALNRPADVPEEEQAQEVQTKLEALKEYRRRSSSYITSIKHPKRLSKRLSSKFKIFIYPSEDRAEVEKVLREAFDDEEWTGSVHPSGVETGDLVVLKLWSADIEFSGEVVKRIEHDVNQVTIGAKPKDTCHPGDHTVTLSISKKDTGEEISSVDFTVQVVDFAFDHVSRPLLSNVVSGFSGVFGAAAVVVTLFTDIDKAMGLTAGTAALAVAAFIQARVWQLFRRPSTTVTPYPP